MTRKLWIPARARSTWQVPEAGCLIAREHAVWEIVKVSDLPLSDDDRDVWLQAGTPDLATWPARPRRVDVRWIGGARPAWATGDGPVNPTTGHLTLPAGRNGSEMWNVYGARRWPMCSCCGEPMPCRAELQDEEIDAGMQEVEKFATRMPGCCWGCGEPVSRRQKSVNYPGNNLDLPGGPEVRFHTRSSCRYLAEKYERRWIGEDPRRERILTYPKCGGILVVHADGSSECRSGRGLLGDEKNAEPDCQGHLTHDHGTQAACYVGDGWLSRREEMPGCPRGCDPTSHHGTGVVRRPERRQSDSLFGGAP